MFDRRRLQANTNLIVLFIFTSLLLLILLFTEKMPPNVTEPIRMPNTSLDIYNPWNPETIPFHYLAIYGVILYLSIFSVFLIFDKLNKKKSKLILSILLISLISLVVKQIIVNTIKKIVASPRPNFKGICQPDEDGFCKLESINSEYYKKRLRRLYFGLTSFPSGHSSAIVWFYCLFFSVSFLFFRPILKKKYQTYSLHIIIFLNIVLLSFTVFVCISRIIDYYHRLVDVIVGSSIGLLNGSLFYFFMRKYKKVYFE